MYAKEDEKSNETQNEEHRRYMNRMEEKKNKREVISARKRLIGKFFAREAWIFTEFIRSTL